MQKAESVMVYEPNYRHKYGFFKTWSTMFKNMLSSRELIYQLFRRDFLMQYKKSFLGQGWILFSPILAVASWVLLHATGILEPGDVGIPFPAYVLLSSSIWGLFMSFYQAGQRSLASGKGFIMQVKFPHEALMVKQLSTNLANFTLSFMLNIVILVIFNVIPAWQIVFFPIVILPMFFLGAGLGLLVSLYSVIAPDVAKIVTAILGLAFYITPIVFAPETRSATLQKIVELNPLTYLVGTPRDLIIYGEIAYPERFLFVAVISFIFFLIAWRAFFVSEEMVIEKMI